MMKVPYGIILIAGPTGSGKSTTLFAMLSELDRETANVVSLEDPVEYEILGVAQSQVRPEIGYTFATGLRTFCRQDPDIIMVGEIRDKETAVLAVQAALTGHLVLPPFIPIPPSGQFRVPHRYGVDPFLIAPTLVAVIGQPRPEALPEPRQALPDKTVSKKSLNENLRTCQTSIAAHYRHSKSFIVRGPTAECPNGSAAVPPSLKYCV